jgi:hypothetical protein
MSSMAIPDPVIQQQISTDFNRDDKHAQKTLTKNGNLQNITAMRSVQTVSDINDDNTTTRAKYVLNQPQFDGYVPQALPPSTPQTPPDDLQKLFNLTFTALNLLPIMVAQADSVAKMAQLEKAFLSMVDLVSKQLKDLAQARNKIMDTERKHMLHHIHVLKKKAEKFGIFFGLGEHILGVLSILAGLVTGGATVAGGVMLLTDGDTRMGASIDAYTHGDGSYDSHILYIQNGMFGVFGSSRNALIAQTTISATLMLFTGVYGIYDLIPDLAANIASLSEEVTINAIRSACTIAFSATNSLMQIGGTLGGLIELGMHHNEPIFQMVGMGIFAVTAYLIMKNKKVEAEMQKEMGGKEGAEIFRMIITISVAFAGMKFISSISKRFIIQSEKDSLLPGVFKKSILDIMPILMKSAMVMQIVSSASQAGSGITEYYKASMQAQNAIGSAVSQLQQSFTSQQQKCLDQVIDMLSKMLSPVMENVNQISKGTEDFTKNIFRIIADDTNRIANSPA